MIRLSSVTVVYRTDTGAHPALDAIDLQVPRGGSCVVIGPTGCGKTSLMYLISGLLRPTSGTVEVDGRALAGTRGRTSLILQQHGLFPWKNAQANVTLGLTLRGVRKEERLRRSRDLMEELGIWDVSQSYPTQLSGGQRQRVAIARSLATEPDLLLMDEPFSALDAMTRESLQNLLLRIWRERGFSFILVTHSIEEAIFLGQKVLILSARPGRVLAEVKNDEMGEERYRLSETFHRRCLEVRGILEGAP